MSIQNINMTLVVIVRFHTGLPKEKGDKSPPNYINQHEKRILLFLRNQVDRPKLYFTL